MARRKVRPHARTQEHVRGVEYSTPHWDFNGSKETAIEECKARVEAGAKCYCQEFCRCRGCQKRNSERGRTTCGPEQLIMEGGCTLGCNQCSKCKPCW